MTGTTNEEPPNVEKKVKQLVLTNVLISFITSVQSRRSLHS
jgi:hypothetical protein